MTSSRPPISELIHFFVSNPHYKYTSVRTYLTFLQIMPDRPSSYREQLFGPAAGRPSTAAHKNATRRPISAFPTAVLKKLPDLNDLTDLNNRPLPIPQPETTVHHDYGNGHNHMNITHCGTMGQQNVGLGGLPRVYVQPTYPDANINYRQIDDQLVSNLLKIILYI